ncbi:(deoxy)nucleoside triphosphate pyrophosphohydrolase [uncultured Sphingomonas sp.]|uniref:(deoxy)nucleoside triphosphate pyrophosphohydrolase n=1 Tax=uncultured Sphingomonas sp. TaxID=158754 RepID=UPI002635798E|nr:(deoxy)nucleoside triphosphate pyrophosphohydrolase [uncultured Sphingomonas sp.]
MAPGIELFLVVAAALVDEAGRVLVQQRPEGKALAGLWEFPGGKIERGETPEAALCRELREELGITVAPADLAPVTFASEPRGERQMILMLYRCRRWAGSPQPLEAAALRWEDTDSLAALPMPSADVPLAAALRTTGALRRVVSD